MQATKIYFSSQYLKILLNIRFDLREDYYFHFPITGKLGETVCSQETLGVNSGMSSDSPSSQPASQEPARSPQKCSMVLACSLVQF